MILSAAPLAWILAFACLVAIAARAVSHGRTEPSGTSVGRPTAFAAFALLFVLVVTAPWAWAVVRAEDGLARIRRSESAGAGSPARARLFLREVSAPVTEDGGVWSGKIGFSPTASLQLPRDYELTEARIGRDLVRIEARADLSLSASVLPTDSRTRIYLRAAERPIDDGPFAAPLGHAMAGTVVRGMCRPLLPAADAGVPSANGAAIYVVLCDGDAPRAALVITQDLRPRPKGTARQSPLVRVRPYVWRNGWKLHQVGIERGDLLQIGALADAVPGVKVWEVPAPPGHPALLSPPRDLLARCDEWTRGASDTGFFFHGAATLEQGTAHHSADSFACVLPVAGTSPFFLEVRRLLPDVGAVRSIGWWAAFLLACPALVLLAAFLIRPPSGRTPQLFGGVLGHTTISTFLVAVFAVRLLWAHRLDMLRDYEPDGTRMFMNELSTVLTAAALAAAAVVVWVRPRNLVWRVAAAAAAWSILLVLGGLALPGDKLALDSRVALQLAFSMAIGMGGIWWPLLVGLGARMGGMTGTDQVPGWRRVLPVLVGLVAIAAVAIVGAKVGRGSVVVKLFAAWSLVVVAYIGLRLSSTPRIHVGSWALVGTGTIVAVLLLKRFDTGVTIAIVGPGLLAALVAAAHAATHAEEDAAKLDNFERYLRPLVLAEAVLFGAASLALILFARFDTDGRAPQAATAAALHLPLAIGLLLVVAAGFVARRRGPWAAAPWVVVALVFFAAWTGRDTLLHRAMHGDSQASKRIAAVVDPAYALLSDDRTFSRALTGWREASLVANAGNASPSEGQGYFGAQLVDPGVLLSVENDYLPVLLLRETGTTGVLQLSLLFFSGIGALFVLAGRRFALGSASSLGRRVLAITIGFLVAYQPVAALGVLPFTGIAWPGLGLDSPSDLWVLCTLLFAIAVWTDVSAPDDAKEHEQRIRRTRPVRSTERALGFAGVLVVIATVIVTHRAARFAAQRPAAVSRRDGAGFEFSAPFSGVPDAIRYVAYLQALRDPGGGPVPLLASQVPTDPDLALFDRRLQDAWARARVPAADVAKRFLAARECVAGRAGPWTIEVEGTASAPDACLLHLRFGWPKLTLRVAASGAPTLTVEQDADVLRALRYPKHGFSSGERFRLVSRPMGDAARDRGELVSGDIVVRLRPGSGALDLREARTGLFFTDRAQLTDDLVLTIGAHDSIVVERVASTTGPGPSVFTYEPTDSAAMSPSDRDGSWTRAVLAPGAKLVVTQTALLVSATGRGRSTWGIRPASQWPGESVTTVGPLLADDITSVRGGRRRDYVFGGLIPELGWLNPSSVGQSLGLDGWARAALSRRADPFGPTTRATPTDDPDAEFVVRACGRRDPITPGTGGEADAFRRVCAASRLDNVMECRVGIQPELELELRHLLEVVTLDPKVVMDGQNPAIASSFALIRGDSGEIVAQANFVPGRQTSAYAPGSAAIEKYLIDAREQRDPVSGRRARGEMDVVKADWQEPIAIGSVLKPLVAWAFERAAPEAAAALVLSSTGANNGLLLGHKPPTTSMWAHPAAGATLVKFLAQSFNWYQAGIGVLATGLPASDGELLVDGQKKQLKDLSQLGALSATHALATRWRGRDVITAGHTVDLAALRTTPFWQEFEKVIGRPLCETDACDERRDLCAARALPLPAANTTRDLAHLVTLGPSQFDFFVSGARGKDASKRVPIGEYFQFLRGSGVHPVGSTLQVADAYSRLFFDPASGDKPYRLAASWFPVAPQDFPRSPPCLPTASGAVSVREGLCEVLRTGTAKELKLLLDNNSRLHLYGAKTGTVDSLDDIASSRAACASFNEAHTPADSSDKRYRLNCQPGSHAPDDSLFVIGFGVVTSTETVPLTLVLRFQGVGTGFAARVVTPFLALVADYFAE